ncbi:glutaminase liver isoform, mitochondrial-like isoform X1 [Tachypleus tridentatus]|uniref:glutaminase liver isoform, mitochondrial-like isoform X1 n=2 Tax=Tachypleus tridentatus TaxID=6853 RepID=UPI003FD58589
MVIISRRLPSSAHLVSSWRFFGRHTPKPFILDHIFNNTGKYSSNKLFNLYCFIGSIRPIVRKTTSISRRFHTTSAINSSNADRVFMPVEEFIRAKSVKNHKEENDNQDEENKTKANANNKEQVLSESTEDGQKNVEDVLFEMFQDINEKVPVGRFLAALSATGLRKGDPRLKEMMTKLRATHKQFPDVGSPEALCLDKSTFKSVVRENIVLISRAFRHHFVIPDFQDFVKNIEDFYWKCKVNTRGKVASYIPQLSKYNPDYWGVSLCTVDGQRYSIGDTEVPFTIQSSGKPLNYAIALNELGSDIVHQYVGQEPSGRMFNELVLDYNKKPHNPMVNAGAIVVCSLLLNIVEPEMRASEKFDWMTQYFKAMAGGEYLGFNNATFLSEREAADRNYAIGFYMKENKCFPEKAVLKEIMDFYFQMCSLEVNSETISIMAATLANGGICPITGQQVIDSHAARDVLSLMHSCGMYDYSGQFAFKVGLPAKSGVSGCTMIVVPNVMGICLWSPPLDVYGNSVRGVQFCEEFIRLFNFHHYDNLRHTTQKKDPRRQKYETKGLKIVSLLFSAASGDVTAMRRHYLSGMDMEQCDYDGRTALHLAAAEGHSECVSFLLKVCGVEHQPKDRWGHTPYDEAILFGHPKVAGILEKWESLREEEKNSPSELKVASRNVNRTPSPIPYLPK